MYEIHIDNDGDAREDITFRFRFKIESRSQTLTVGDRIVALPFATSGPVLPGDSSRLSVTESYTLDVVRGGHGRARVITNALDSSSTFIKPIDNIGRKTIPDYDGYAAQYVYSIDIPGCAVAGSRLFVGQRKDPFVANVGV